MHTYLITFPHAFAHAQFKENLKKYFHKLSDYDIITYNTKFCEVICKNVYTTRFYIDTLKADTPNIKIVHRRLHKGKTKYTTL